MSALSSRKVGQEPKGPHEPRFNYVSSEDHAAIKIQAICRGYVARKAFLPRADFAKYKPLCDRITSGETLSVSTAAAGKTNVFLPQELPNFALKQSGQIIAANRFHKMQQVRPLLQKLGCTNLIIPKARLCGEFLVEERLPIPPSSYENIALYVKNPIAFDDAIKQLVRLFSKAYLPYLVGDQVYRGKDAHLLLGPIPGVSQYVRYDNLPLYIEHHNGNPVGKIGLIDLERFENEPNKKALCVIARIFPLHAEVILKEAKACNLSVEEFYFEDALEQGRKYLQGVYTDHHNWVNQHEHIPKGSITFNQLSEERIQALVDKAQEELLRMDKGQNPLYEEENYFETPKKHFLGEHPEEVARQVAQVAVPNLLKKLYAQIEEYQSKNQPNLSFSDGFQIRLRSAIVSFSQLKQVVDQALDAHQEIDLKSQSPADDHFLAHLMTSRQLVHFVFKELVAQGILFQFQPFEVRMSPKCWVRF